MVTAQLFTLVGVAVGALASHLAGSLNERTRYRREVARGWQERKLDCFATYVNDVKTMSVIARRITAFRDLHGRAPDKLDPETDGPCRRLVKTRSGSLSVLC